ncbi:hypothetical protein PI95_030425 [Hassallia byssoidea VB512170]|uniref:Uncharacterized protein n=1 Tax=Hassallia byssoidea VB512170 TaxID=1304833 RepID=A0A846HIM3_9CYAN|nr:hypothetical protein [Hassalia byssoidea]NEU76709.1 hypothetical protein [Hassalia byssoidea VB512170]
MGYPTVNLKAANYVFEGIGIEITKHELGYYQAIVRGEELKEPRLIDLTHKILRTISQPPYRNPKFEANIPD